MPHSDLSRLLPLLPQAVLRVDGRLNVTWVEADFTRKTGVVLEVGGALLDALEQGRGRDALEHAVREGRAHAGHVLTCALRQVRVQVQPVGAAEGGGALLVLEPSGVDDEVAFSRALQEIARAVSETLEVNSVCAAAVIALVRCAQVQRAEVYLSEAGQGLRRVAVSDLAAPGAAPESPLEPEADAFQKALATGQPQIGIQRGYGDAMGCLFAALPLVAQGRTVGLLLLYKAQGTAFSVRELDLWSAAAGQLAVAVENARLLREAQSALKVREEFMSIASHELKTPLTPLKLSLWGMERRLAAGQPVELSTVLKCKRQVDRLAGLVDHLLDASRLELGKLSLQRAPLELAQLVAEVVDQFRHAFGRSITLAVPAERLWVQGDRDRLEQVLVNLLENAHKYSPAAEPIAVEVGALPDGTGGEGDVCLRVRDRGIGIPGADQSQVFQRFYRARNASHRNFGGLGLGLFISRSIARMHGGELALTSTEGAGASFTLTLPRLPAVEVAALPRRVLLLDEDREQEAEAERVLRAQGYEVLVARDGAEALRKAATGAVDLVLLSASAEPTQAGVFLETFATLPRARPVPLLLAGTERPGWAGPAAPLCPRPYRAEELARAVRQQLGASFSQD
ncbi:histidine kinase [Aggregicoccus sp. 17bor-14]|uniref:ATP-binding protein n=1 Tax=Myxococcaceae TaxID=31 RepID=UPI00129CEB17|nr:MULTISPECIES: ATP-binding protein [Myxococcaceae]MBF5042400.1 GAF domain-containing protein [Simulacricoccus sp. 17bor-14]MRI88172.1 histidine kinase [Aggregicoccus sp. 17bor-14]